MMLKDLFQDYLVNYETSIKYSPISTTESIEIPTNKYSRLLTYSEAKKQNESKENPIKESSIIKWTYYTPSEGIVTQNSEIKRQLNPYQNQKKWVTDMITAYKKVGLNDNAIKNLIAKNALESNWGKSVQGDYNFGNITTGNSWTGKFTKGKDHDSNGREMSQKFRAYDSIDDYVKDEIQFLTKLYDFDQNDDLSTFLNKLQGGNKGNRKYAEDPSYKTKVKQVYLKI